MLLVQDLSRLKGTPLVLYGGHFEGGVPQLINGKVVVNEIVPASISLLTGTFTIEVGHFSGWIGGGGYESPPKDSTTQTQ